MRRFRRVASREMRRFRRVASREMLGRRGASSPGHRAAGAGKLNVPPGRISCGLTPSSARAPVPTPRAARALSRWERRPRRPSTPRSPSRARARSGSSSEPAPSWDCTSPRGRRSPSSPSRLPGVPPASPRRCPRLRRYSEPETATSARAPTSGHPGKKRAPAVRVRGRPALDAALGPGAAGTVGATRTPTQSPEAGRAGRQPRALTGLAETRTRGTWRRAARSPRPERRVTLLR